MKIDRHEILQILDQCRENYTFPMMDNGYVYPASSRLSVFRSNKDWAIVIEIFGFSPRNGSPDLCITTFGSKIENRKTEKDYVNSDAYKNYINSNPNNESICVYPFDDNSWIDEEDQEIINKNLQSISLRKELITIPNVDDYKKHGIVLINNSDIFIFEFCRIVAALHREKVLATNSELRTNIPVEMNLIIQIDEWNHPNIVDSSVRIKDSETFQQLAKVIEKNNIKFYNPKQHPNSHWRNWPEAGLL